MQRVTMKYDVAVNSRAGAHGPERSGINMPCPGDSWRGQHGAPTEACLWQVGGHTPKSGREAADPDAGRGGFAEMESTVGGAKGERFIVFATGYGNLCSGVEMEAIEEFEKFSVFFVDTNDFGTFVGLQIREQDSTLFAKLREASAKGDAVRARPFVCEALEEKSFYFRRDGMFEAFGFVVGFGPGEADDVGEKHFGKLVAEGHVFCDGAAFAREIDVAVAGNGDEVIAAHAFERSGDGGRSYTELFSKARADGRLTFFEKLPDGFEVVFLGDAGFCAHLSDCS
jgi:hypothetical protein